jgi:hypothetical protein
MCGGILIELILVVAFDPIAVSLAGRYMHRITDATSKERLQYIRGSTLSFTLVRLKSSRDKYGVSYTLEDAKCIGTDQTPSPVRPRRPANQVDCSTATPKSYVHFSPEPIPSVGDVQALVPYWTLTSYSTHDYEMSLKQKMMHWYGSDGSTEMAQTESALGASSTNRTTIDPMPACWISAARQRHQQKSTDECTLERRSDTTVPEHSERFNELLKNLSINQP